MSLTLRDFDPSSANQIIVIFDRALTGKERGVLSAAVKPIIKEGGRPFRVLYHSTRADFNGQVADYAAWAMYVSLERGEGHPLKEIDGFHPEIIELWAK